jgi:tRNA nucleotidyltransferase (CCA-adding enzyme)
MEEGRGAGDLERVLERAREIAIPTSKEEERLSSVAREVLTSVDAAFAGVEGFVRATLEGSAAKGTWIRARPEVDVFVHFSPNVSRERLEEVVVERGSSALEALGASWRLRYADHPYVEGFIGEVTVNVVGCYATEPGKWLSPVDRTPYHTRYVLSRLDDRLRAEVRLAKAFMRGIGVYGAELRIGGFSGYLVELLVLWYGSFLALLRDGASWRPGEVIEMSGKRSEQELRALFPNSPLIVTDPVDSNRNVASAVTLTRFSEFVLASRLFLSEPSVKYFDPRPPAPRDTASLLGGLMAVRLRDLPELPTDTMWGEVLKFARSVERRLQKEGFNVRRWAAESIGNEVLLLFDLEALDLPELELRVGPPVWMKDAEDFVREQLGNPLTVVGPWVSGERLYVLRKRSVRSAEELLMRWIDRGEVSVPKDIAGSVRAAGIFRVTSERFSELRSSGYSSFVDSFLDGRPPFLR